MVDSNIAVTGKAATISGVFTAFMSNIEITDIALLVGIVTTVATYLTHLYFQVRRDRREEDNLKLAKDHYRETHDKKR